MRFWAALHNNKAMEFEEEGRIEDAIACYEKAIKSDAEWTAPWFNLGLLYKRQRLWEKSLICNQRAIELNPKHEGALWNLGIAATALENWKEARRAWSAYGIKIADGHGPIEMDFGPTPIRINPEADGEIVWCRRIDPARVIIESVPLPDSHRRYGDLLLNDGEPKGYRLLGEQELPVFNELQLLAPSEYGTYLVSIDDLEKEALGAAIDDANVEEDLAVEDWSEVRWICRECSEGRPFNENHIHEPVKETERKVGFAAISKKRVNDLLAIWQCKFPEAKFSEVEIVLLPFRGN